MTKRLRTALKEAFPRREFRSRWHEFQGDIIQCRGKGSSAKWLTFARSERDAWREIELQTKKVPAAGKP